MDVDTSGPVPRNPHTRLLTIPGLHDSGPAHWQTWLETINRDAVRVTQRHWADPDVDRWASRIASVIEQRPSVRWIAAAHSFGCLALTRLAALRPDLSIEAALLVAPADPDRFGIAGLLPSTSLPYSSTVVSSQTDPWLLPAKARLWSRRWHSHWLDLGDAGHINAEAGFGPLPVAQRWITSMHRRADRERRIACRGIEDWQVAVRPPSAAAAS